ncbi:MAG: hypothetical protein JWP02_2931 [Acidimicrobiales bacterium]|nr:hypothetical protein [Acidimicrobiales bacterium]
MTTKSVEMAVARRMCRQQSVITKDQAIACGMTPAEIRTRHESGLWVREESGLYRSAEAPVTWAQNGMSACLVAGPGAVLSRRSAAVVWGFSGFRPGPIDITVPAGRSGRNAIARVHRVRELLPADITRRNGLPVTRPALTLVHLAGSVSLELLEEAVDDALIRRLVPLETFRTRVASARGRGIMNLRRVLELWPPGPLPGSLGEMRATRWLCARGAPLGERQYVIRDRRGRFVAQVDRAWPDKRVVLERDSMRWHGTPRGLARDELRYPKLRALGWAVFSKAPDDDLTDVLHALECAERAA